MYFIYRIEYYETSETVDETIDCGFLYADNYVNASNLLIEDYGNDIAKIYLEKFEDEFNTISSDTCTLPTGLIKKLEEKEF